MRFTRACDTISKDSPIETIEASRDDAANPCIGVHLLCCCTTGKNAVICILDFYWKVHMLLYSNSVLINNAPDFPIPFLPFSVTAPGTQSIRVPVDQRCCQTKKSRGDPSEKK